MGEAPTARSGWALPQWREVLFAFLGLTLVGAIALGPYIGDGGFYLDDWADAAGRFYPPGGESFGNVMSYFSTLFEYRPVLIVFTPVKYSLLGTDISAHIAWTVLFAVLVGTMLYAILRTVRVPWYHAWCIAALTLVFPWFDSIRLWGSGNPSLLAIALAFGGILIALAGVLRRSALLHACAALLYLLSILTYEIALPLIAAAGALYVLVAGWQAARWRWATDLAVVVAGGVWVGTHTTRTVSGGTDYVGRFREVFDGGTEIAGRTFVAVGQQPRTWLALGIAAGVLALGAAAYAERSSRGEGDGQGGWGGRQWLLLAAGGIAVTVLGWAIFVAADPYYTPTVFGISNRVNALAGYGLLILAYAVLGTGVWLLTLVLPSVRRWAPHATVALAVLLALSYVHVLDRHVGLWQKAFSAQETALQRIEDRYPGPPPETTLFTTGYPAYQTLGVAIFATPWDLNAAVKLRLEDGTLSAYPVVEGTELVCGPGGVGMRGEGATDSVAPYGTARLLNLTTGAHANPPDRRRCEAVLDRFAAGPMYVEYEY